MKGPLIITGSVTVVDGARIGEYLAVKLQADAAYSSILAHNPMSRASRGRYRTDWLRHEPYSLAELAGYIPKGWRRPRRPQTVYGRNDTLFRTGMRWTGRPAHWGDWAGMATCLAAMNAEFVLPLGERELGGIVKSIRRIQTKNLRSGQTQRTFSFIGFVLRSELWRVRPSNLVPPPSPRYRHWSRRWA